MLIFILQSIFPILVFSQPITRHALLVGIGNYPQQSGWPALHSDQDARRLNAEFRKNGILEHNIKLLLNEEATIENIQLAMKHLVDIAEPEDQVYIYFGGHSQQQTDISGDELDGLDETFVSYGTWPENQEGNGERTANFSDDDLGKWLARIADKVTRFGSVFVIYDGGISQCCPGKRGIKGLRKPKKILAPKGKAMPIEFDNDWLDFTFSDSYSQVVSLNPDLNIQANNIEKQLSDGNWSSPLVQGVIKGIRSKDKIRCRELSRFLDLETARLAIPVSYRLDGAVQQEVFRKTERHEENLPIANAATGEIYSVTIGVSKYQNVSPLQYGHADAGMFFNLLQFAFGKVLKPENQFLFLDSNATIKPIVMALEEINSKLKEGDKVYFYFAGHGDVENLISRKAHLLLYNSPSHVYKAGGTLPVEDIKDYVNQWTYKKARVFLVVDACKSGKLAGGEAGKEATVAYLNEYSTPVARILSCQPNEFSEESTEFGGGHGAFTYFLVRGIHGSADIDGDSVISIKEIGQFISDSVAIATGKSQNPLVVGNRNLPFLHVVMPHFHDRGVLELNSSKSVSLTGTGISTDDSLKSRWVREYRKFLKTGAILGPKDQCAHSTYERIANTFPLEDKFLKTLQTEMQIAIDQRSQSLINEYIKGNEQLAKEEVFASAAAELAYLLENHMSIGDHLYFMYLSRRYFFEGRSIKPRKVDNDLQRHTLNKAIQNLRTSLKYEPEGAQNYNAIARLRQVNKQYEEAITNYRKAIAIAPSWKFPLNNLATAFDEMAMAQNRPVLFDSAILYYKKTISIDPGFAGVYKNYGKTLVNKGEGNQAKLQYQKSLFLDPTFSEAYQNLADLYRQEQKWDSAMYYLRIGLGFHPKHPDLLTNMGNVFYDQLAGAGENKAILKKEAFSWYEKACTADPLCLEANLGMGNLFWENDQFDSAAKYYEQVVFLDSTTSAFQNYLIESLLRKGNLGKAELLIIHLTKTHPSDAMNWFDYGVLAILQKKAELAIGRFQKAISLGIKDKAIFEEEPLIQSFRTTKAYFRLIEGLKN